MGLFNERFLSGYEDDNFNSKNFEKEKKRYKKLVKRLFEGLRLNLKSLRSIIEDVIKLGKEAYGMKDLHCYDYGPVKKKCSLSC